MNLLQVVVCFVLIGVISADKEESFGPMTVHLSSTSGKINITRLAKNDSTVGPRHVAFEFVSLQEQRNDSNQNPISSRGYSNFASQTFTITNPADTTIGGSQAHARYMSMTSNFLVGQRSVTLTVNVYIIKNDDTIVLGDETHDVKEDNVKFDVKITGWPFCTSTSTDCNGHIGEFLDLAMEIKSFEDPTEHPGGDHEGEEGKKSGEEGKESSEDESFHENHDRKAPKWKLGQHAELLLSKKIRTDGSGWEPMGHGFPKVAKQGGKNIITIRFPTFQTEAIYDPTVNIPEEDGSGETSSGKMLTYSSLLLVLAMLQKIFH